MTYIIKKLYLKRIEKRIYFRYFNTIIAVNYEKYKIISKSIHLFITKAAFSNFKKAAFCCTSSEKLFSDV